MAQYQRLCMTHNIANDDPFCVGGAGYETNLAHAHVAPPPPKLIGGKEGVACEPKRKARKKVSGPAQPPVP